MKKKILISVIILFLIIAIAYVILIAPNTNKDRKKQMEIFEKHYIAHRGYFDNKTDIVENSMKAFENAVNNNYGIELDVQMTKDKKLVVFHDFTLDRMVGIKKKITECTYSELKTYKLKDESNKDTTQSIPLFEDVLSMVNGRVPIVVEIKVLQDGYKELSSEVAKVLDIYKGPYCVECFNPLVLKWYKKNRPNVIRGILSTDYKKDKIQMTGIQSFILSNMFLNFITKPDFIAYNHKHYNQFTLRFCRDIFKAKTVAWTIRSEEELKSNKLKATVFIFDSFKPNQKELDKK